MTNLKPKFFFFFNRSNRDEPGINKAVIWKLLTFRTDKIQGLQPPSQKADPQPSVAGFCPPFDRRTWHLARVEQEVLCKPEREDFLERESHMNAYSDGAKTATN